jgi:hypothetical protein
VEVALAAGVDGLAHVWRKGGANADIAGRITERGVFVIATLATGFSRDERASATTPGSRVGFRRRFWII